MTTAERRVMEELVERLRLCRERERLRGATDGVLRAYDESLGRARVVLALEEQRAPARG